MEHIKPLVLVSMLIGGVFLVFADWVGRQLIAPWQIPAGLVVSLLAGLAIAALFFKRS